VLAITDASAGMTRDVPRSRRAVAAGLAQAASIECLGYVGDREAFGHRLGYH
jgi:alkylation response protein AidB-like acyl-CoA dehydrogenase